MGSVSECECARTMGSTLKNGMKCQSYLEQPGWRSESSRVPPAGPGGTNSTVSRGQGHGGDNSRV